MLSPCWQWRITTPIGVGEVGCSVAPPCTDSTIAIPFAAAGAAETIGVGIDIAPGDAPPTNSAKSTVGGCP